MDNINYVQIISSFFIMTNPLVLTSIFISITKEHTNKEKYKIATVCLIASSIILIGFVFFGNYILQLIGINIVDLYMAGGLLLLLIGLSMVLGKGNKSQISKKDKDSVDKDDVTLLGLVPLAVPMVAGPGTIVFAIVYAKQCQTIASRSLLICIIMMVLLTVWICMLFSSKLGKLIGKAGQSLISRLMGLLLVAVAASLIVHGIKQAFDLS